MKLNRHEYLTEFLEVGGLMTLLEVLTLRQAADEHKLLALKVNSLHQTSVHFLSFKRHQSQN